MEEAFRFIIPGSLKGKGRPRFSSNGMAYTPGDTATNENFIKACYIEQGGKSFGCKSVSVSLLVSVKPPTKFNKKQREAALSGQMKPAVKPDIDNMIKQVLDALNGLAYDDDIYVYKVSAEKQYAASPTTTVCIEAVA